MAGLKTEAISSAANPLLKDVRRAILHGALTADGLLVAEGFHLLEEALASSCRVETVLASETSRTAVAERVGRRARIVTVADRPFQALASTESTQGVIALVHPPVWSLPQLFPGASLVLVLDGVQDPGNAGTIARAGEAFGATGLIFLKGSVSPFNAKTQRAAAGSLFRLPYVHGLDADLARAALRQQDARLYAGVAAAGPARAVDRVDLARPCAIVIGSEGRGVSITLREAAEPVTIPTAGVESLNAAIAAAILLYEARRQRTQHP